MGQDPQLDLMSPPFQSRNKLRSNIYFENREEWGKLGAFTRRDVGSLMPCTTAMSMISSDYCLDWSSSNHLECGRYSNQSPFIGLPLTEWKRKEIGRGIRKVDWHVVDNEFHGEVDNRLPLAGGMMEKHPPWICPWLASLDVEWRHHAEALRW